MFLGWVLNFILILIVYSKEEYLKTDGKQWREKRNNSVDKYRRFKNGVYSVKRHTSNMNEYEYVDPPPQSNISSEPSCDKSVNNQVSEVVSYLICYIL